MSKTQLEHARSGTITAAMERVADREQVESETIREAVASGDAVIPANPSHESLDPIVIGREFSTKVNANIGTSSLSDDLGAERDKLQTALDYGADTVMDLSTEGPLDKIRKDHIARSPIPIGTVPIYAAATTVDSHTELTQNQLLTEIESQARQGVDYMTIHAGLLKEHLSYADDRLTGIVSRGGSILAAWMDEHDAENPLYTAYDDICQILREHDVTISLGDGLRPGSIADAGDAAQYAELDVLGELTTRAKEHGVQVMIEGPGHMTFDQIADDVKRQQEICDGAPYYVLGPVVTDIAPGYDHITSAIGGTEAARAGAAMLCYVTPAEHLGLPDESDVREGIIAARIAAHAADIATGTPHDWDNALSSARASFNWPRQFELAIDSERARDGFKSDDSDDDQSESTQQRFCSMCGVEYCSMRIDQDRKDTTESDTSADITAIQDSDAPHQNLPDISEEIDFSSCPAHIP